MLTRFAVTLSGQKDTRPGLVSAGMNPGLTGESLLIMCTAVGVCYVDYDGGQKRYPKESAKAVSEVFSSLCSSG